MSDKLWREVQEILERAEREKPPLRRRLRWPKPHLSLPRVSLPRPTFGQMLLLALGIIVLGYVLGSLGDVAGRVLVLGGLGAFALIFFLSLRRVGQPPEKRWRGQPLDLGRPSVGRRFLGWLGRWRGRR
jgi:hypothetical protein